ncbi:Protein of unknown function [Ekhidna lutea]|uniref:DUF3667 domain-containing protein n=1 Tax=Ekhidna lutea TaxID=447679 RepID=A0A239EL61_EKHLU|nr:DUF3667 domain-containing protein [Ekhidna lutea]SNS45510.1 Protein of unknown function [Ekhidna lutea]
MERICKNCETKLDKGFKYCPRCGQEHKDKVVHFKQFILDFLGDYFTFDSLIIRSVRPLIFKPGFLTNEFIAGRRVRYIPPLRMFIFISIIFFLILGPVEQTVEIERSEEAEFLDSFFNVWFPRLFFLLLPLFALFLYMMFRKPGRFYLTHFIFSVHFHAFTFVLLTIMVILIDHIFPTSVFLSQWSLMITVLLLQLYLFFALRRVYEQKWFTILFKLVIINIMYVISAMIIFSGVGALIFYL